MLKTGIISTAYFGYDDYADGLKKAKSHGYDCVDFQGFISPSSPLYAYGETELRNYLDDLKSAADDAGVKLWQMHGLWPHDDATKESRAEVLLRHKKAIEAAGRLGVKYFVLHPAMPYGWGQEPSLDEVYDITAERFYALLPTARENGVVLCIENMPFSKGHSFSCVKDIKDFVRRIDDESLKACFDSGHCFVTGDDHYDAIKLLCSDLAALHLHDDRSGQDRHLIPFQGDIDWNKVIAALREINFSGCISLETAISENTPQPIKERMQISLAEIARYIAREITKK